MRIRRDCRLGTPVSTRRLVRLDPERRPQPRHRAVHAAHEEQEGEERRGRADVAPRDVPDDRRTRGHQHDEGLRTNGVSGDSRWEGGRSQAGRLRLPELGQPVAQPGCLVGRETRDPGVGAGARRVQAHAGDAEQCSSGPR